ALRVSTPRQRLQEIWCMNASVTEDNDLAALNELPVRLVFELGRLELTLAELEVLGPGHVFALGRDQHQPVDILANGKRIGLGEIVAVGDALGVRVTRLGDA